MDRSRCLLHVAKCARKGLGAFRICCAALLWAAFCTGPARAATAAPTIHRIVAVGDLHGDLSAWRAIARAAGVMDAHGHWAGGDTVLVQDGDVVDRGPSSLAIIHDLMRLEREAPRAHGRVIALVGNHEAMNMTGDLRYVSPADFAGFVDAGSSRRRDAVFAANETAIYAAYRKRDPSMTAQAIRRAWFEATPLGWAEHEAAWRPDGPIGSWVIGHPAVHEDGPVRTALVSRPGHARSVRRDRGPADRGPLQAIHGRAPALDGAGARPGSGRIWRRADGCRAYADPFGHRCAARGPAGADRHRDIRRIRW